MTRKINEIYDQTIQALMNNSRALPKYSEEVIRQLKEEFDAQDFSKMSTDEAKEFLKKIFCILTNTQTTTTEFQDMLLKSYEKVKMLKNNSDLIIMMLAAVSKQFIDHSSKSGKPIPIEIFNLLKNNLLNKNPEVLEWTLRAIDSLGPQGLRLEKEVKSLRPSLLKIFNKHQQAAFEIVNHIEKEWSRLKNEKK